MAGRRRSSSSDSGHRQPFRVGSLRTHDRRSAANLSAFETCNTTIDGAGNVGQHASPVHSRASLKLIVEPGLYMLLRFQKAAGRGNYGTGNQAFSKCLRFLTIRDETPHTFAVYTVTDVAKRDVYRSYRAEISLIQSPLGHRIKGIA